MGCQRIQGGNNKCRHRLVLCTKHLCHKCLQRRVKVPVRELEQLKIRISFIYVITRVRLSLLRSSFLTYYRATCIRVSGKTNRTNTVWYVISYVAFCTLSTEIWTRISALLSNTGLVAGALGVWYAFRFAIWWSAYIFSQTAAGWGVVDHLTLGIWTAGWRLTRVRRRYYFFYK